MLKIWVKGFQDNCIKDPSKFFDLHKSPKIFDMPYLPYVRRIIKEIDHVDVVKGEHLMSRTGAISPQQLSSGSKGLILLYVMPKCNLYASGWGDNCAPFILDMAKHKDIEITLHHIMDFPTDFEGMFMDTGKEIHSIKDYLKGFLSMKYGDGR